MPFDPDGNFTLPTRQELISRYERDYKLRNPNARTGANSLVTLDAAAMADTMLPAYADSKTLADSADLEKKTQAQLDQECTRLRIPTQLGPRGASGFVKIVASEGGTTIFKDDELTDKKTGLIYRCTRTDTYEDEEEVPIVGKDTGPQTNVPAGTLLQWTAPRPGCGATATVVEQADGSGLKGGRPIEAPDEQIARIRQARRWPAVAGNAAAFIAAIQDTPDVGVEAGFAYCATRGPGSIVCAFTLRPTLTDNGIATGSRVPSANENQLVKAHIVGQMAEDDSIVVVTIVQQPITFVLEVTWADTTTGWADVNPWPLYDSLQPVVVSAVTSATQFQLSSGNPSMADPVAGQTIAFYDRSTGTWARKRILTVSGGDPWDITCDQTNNASDVAFAPSVGDLVSPWSESLDLVSPAVLESFASLGPGELGTLFDPGLRVRRFPKSPAQWPHVLSTRVLDPLFSLAILDNVEVKKPSLPNATTVGLPGSIAYLQELVKFAIHPEQ